MQDRSFLTAEFDKHQEGRMMEKEELQRQHWDCREHGQTYILIARDFSTIKFFFFFHPGGVKMACKGFGQMKAEIQPLLSR